MFCAIQELSEPNHDAKAVADAVNIIPASQLGCPQSGPELLQGPARKAIDPMVRLAIRCR